jgi:hypothetical protein
MLNNPVFLYVFYVFSTGPDAGLRTPLIIRRVLAGVVADKKRRFRKSGSPKK